MREGAQCSRACRSLACGGSASSADFRKAQPGFWLGSVLGSRDDPLLARRRACTSPNRTPSISLAPRVNSNGAGYKVSISFPRTYDTFLSPHSLASASSACLETELSSCETYDRLPSALARSLATPLALILLLVSR